VLSLLVEGIPSVSKDSTVSVHRHQDLPPENFFLFQILPFFDPLLWTCCPRHRLGSAVISDRISRSSSPEQSFPSDLVLENRDPLAELMSDFFHFFILLVSPINLLPDGFPGAFPFHPPVPISLPTCFPTNPPLVDLANRVRISSRLLRRAAVEEVVL